MTLLKQRLATGGPAVMVNLSFNSPLLVEHLAGLGFDAVMIDCEHTSASVERVEELARAARATGIAAIVRPEKLDDALITHVDDASAARKMVEIVRYARPDSHQKLVLVAMIESKSAVTQIDEILGVEGIDVFFLARVDLSKSLGFGGDKRHPQVRSTVDGLIARIRASGRQAGAAGDYDQVEDIVAQGVSLVFVGTKALLEPGARSYLDKVAQAHAQRSA
jgi:4-hydroxy-2-oxoheptanedioate aldolase